MTAPGTSTAPDPQILQGAEPGHARKLAWQTALILLMTLLLAALPRLLSPEIQRPFEQDELVTLGSTSAGMFGTVAELQERPRFDIAEAARGFARPFAGRWDPNYHIIHSWALTVTSFFTGYSEPAVRLPALLGFLASLAVVQWLLWSITGSRVFMVLGGLAYATLPYGWYYSVSARGYSMLLLFVACQFALLRPEVWRRVNCHWIFFSLSLLNVLCFLNMASTLVTWIAPFSLALLLMIQPRPREVQAGPNAGLLGTRWQVGYRVQWSQAAIMGFVACLVFLLCKLHNFIEAQSRYGYVATSRTDALGELARAMVALFPGLTVLLVLLAAISAGALVGSRRFSAAPLLITGLTLVFCALYSAASLKVAWERTYGFIIPPAFLLIAYGWSLTKAANRTVRLGLQGVLAAGLLLASGGGIAEILREQRAPTPPTLAYSVLSKEFTTKLNAGEIPLEGPAFILKPYSWDVNAYLPRDPQLHMPELQDGVAFTTFYLLEQPRGAQGNWLRTLTWSENSSNEMHLPAAAVGAPEVLIQHEVRAIARKTLLPRVLQLGEQPRTATPVLGIALNTDAFIGRPEVHAWMLAQAPEDFQTAHITLQGYSDAGTMMICWVTPEWPASRWCTLLSSFFPAQAAGQLWTLEVAP